MTYHTGKQYIIAALLLVIAIEGAIIAMDSDSNEEDYSAFIDKIDELNEKGGKVWFNNGNYNEFSGGQNIVSVKGDTVIFKAHGAYKENVCPLSNIAYFQIY